MQLGASVQSIASSAPRENVEVMLRVLDLTQYLNAIVGAEDVTIGKPDPQVVDTKLFSISVDEHYAQPTR